MNRRSFLWTATAVAVGSAGCAGRFAGTESLGDPSVTNEESGRAFYNFSRDGEPAVSVDVGIRPRERPTARGTVRVSVTPESALRTESIRLALRAPAVPEPGEQTARFFLELPDGPNYPPFSLHVDEDQYAVVAVDELTAADLGTGTIPLALAVVPTNPVRSLSIRCTTVSLGARGSRVVASLADELSMPVE